ncbi:MAG: hypothetical protein A4E69_03120 [Syntrophus sp. PtaB.Bin138]|jgi:hypothetical protein|nr:MAG: hypothetical protein A4E69_03120 [Syntrophus sp. PtaB.Bin138]
MVIDLKKRKELLLSERVIKSESESWREAWEEEISSRLPAGAFGAVLARAGMGKTAFLVQMALSSMLGGEGVLHVSLHEPISKVTLWYRELFEKKFIRKPPRSSRMLWETILPHRFIMTFRVDRFSIPNLEERLNDLIVQGIFSPRILLIDGWQTNHIGEAEILELKTFARAHNLQVWLSVHVHRHDAEAGDPLPAFLKKLEELFDIILQMEDRGQEILIDPHRDATGSLKSWRMKMDPVTLLITAGRARDPVKKVG